VGANLISQIPHIQTDFRQFLPENAKYSLRLSQISENELKDVINNLKQSASGHDDIPVAIVKECAPEIISFLTSIINRSFKSGCFPSHLQIAKVIPIYKKGDANLPENYEPISLITIFSKIFEKNSF